jgi:hypothetical protein
MISFQIASDLHIEICRDTPPALSLIKPAAEILILAGDIGRIHKHQQLRTFLQDVCQHFRYVLYVLGNHEFYRVKGIPDKSIDELWVMMRDIEKKITNLYILNRSSLVIGNICIAGCILWSRPLVNVPSFIVRIAGMNTDKYRSLHEQDVQYIEKIVRYCSSKKLRLVVVTHHCPSYSLLAGKKLQDKYKSLYVSNLDYLLDVTRVHTWICGHVNINFDLRTKNGTRLVSNQKGKPKNIVRNFSKEKVILV